MTKWSYFSIPLRRWISLLAKNAWQQLGIEPWTSFYCGLISTSCAERHMTTLKDFHSSRNYFTSVLAGKTTLKLLFLRFFVLRIFWWIVLKRKVSTHPCPKSGPNLRLIFSTMHNTSKCVPKTGKKSGIWTNLTNNCFPTFRQTRGKVSRGIKS